MRSAETLRRIATVLIAVVGLSFLREYAVSPASAEETPGLEALLEQFRQQSVSPKAVTPLKQGGGKDRWMATVDFPSVGFMLRRVSNSGAFLPHCTVTLIAPDVVVTAAHCICEPLGSNAPILKYSLCTGDRSAAFLKPGNYEIYFQHSGARSVSNLAGSISIYPGWDGSDFANGNVRGDLAVVKLSAKVENIAPAKIAAPTEFSQELQQAVTVGFGRNRYDPNNQFPPGIKFHAFAAVKPCVGGAVGMLCYTWTTNTSSPRPKVDGIICYGDSGGPLFSYDPGRSASENEFQLLGVASAITSVNAGIVSSGECVNGNTSFHIALSGGLPNMPIETWLSGYAAATNASLRPVYNEDSRFLVDFMQQAFRTITLPSDPEGKIRFDLASTDGTISLSVNAQCENENCREQSPIKVRVVSPRQRILDGDGAFHVSFSNLQAEQGTWVVDVQGKVGRSYQFVAIRD